MERHFQVHGNGQAADILSKEKDWNKIYTFHWMSYNDKQVAGEKTKSVTSRKRATKARTGRWDSAPFSSIFLASSFSCSQAESIPTQTSNIFLISPALDKNLIRV